MTTRRRPTKDERHAAALLQVKGCSCPTLIPYGDAKLMSADQIISLFNDDHYPIPVAEEGSNHPSNLMPRLIAAHREKTAKIDVPQIAKGKRLRAAEAQHAAVRAIGAPVIERERPRSRLQSRGFDRSKTKGFNGKVRERKASTVSHD